MRDCDHDECAAYRWCQAISEEDRRDDFWFRRKAGLPTADLGTDPLAWLNGDTPA